MAMSKETYPVLAGFVPAFEMFMTSWEQLADKNPPLRKWIEEGLTLARKYYHKMDDTDAFVIAMCKNGYLPVLHKY